ncbi:MAG: hypothetical protein ABI670_01080 [Chloroflexota bacterium]
MDTIRFEVRTLAEPGFQGETQEVAIYINGRNLVDIVREYEMPFTKRDGNTLIAGGYAGLPPAGVLPPSGHFLGEPSWAVYRDIDRVSVLECTCGVPGCWPFMVRITVDEERVIWSDFEQPHRRQGSPAGEWRYDALGPLVFDRRQYVEALSNLASLGAALEP